MKYPVIQLSRLPHLTLGRRPKKQQEAYDHWKNYHPPVVFYRLESEPAERRLWRRVDFRSLSLGHFLRSGQGSATKKQTNKVKGNGRVASRIQP